MAPAGKEAAGARALQGARVLAWNQGGYDNARAVFEEGLAIKRESGDE